MKITCSRSFGEWVTTKEGIVESVASFAAQAAEKLRRHAMLASGCNVFAQVHRTGGGGEFVERTAVFPSPTDATNEIIAAVRPAAEALFVPGLGYRKTGVVFFGLEKAGTARQLDLFTTVAAAESSPLYRAVDLLNAKYGAGKVFSASEGIRFADGRYVGEGTQSGSTDVFGHKYLAGTAKALELAVKEKFGCKVRSIELNLPQRCASHLASKTDLDESVAVGAYAVERAADGESGEMVLFLRVSEKPYEVKLGAKKVSEIANAVRKVPDEYINAQGNHITEACADYILPLIAGEAYPEYENGLPKYIVL